MVEDVAKDCELKFFGSNSALPVPAQFFKSYYFVLLSHVFIPEQ